MDQIAIIEDYASLFLTIDEIAMLMNLDAETLRREIRHKQSDLAKAYWRGKLRTVVAMRRQTLTYAEKGSPTAENLMQDYQLKQGQNE